MNPQSDCYTSATREVGRCCFSLFSIFLFVWVFLFVRTQIMQSVLITCSARGKVIVSHQEDKRLSQQDQCFFPRCRGEKVGEEEDRMSQVALLAAGMCSLPFQGDGCCCICPQRSRPPLPHLSISPHTPPPAHSRHSAGWFQAVERLIPGQRVFGGNHLSRGCEQRWHRERLTVPATRPNFVTVNLHQRGTVMKKKN